MADRKIRRRSFDDVRAEAISAERIGMLRHVEQHRAAMAHAVARGKVDEATAAYVNRQIAAFAEGCAIGLHIDGDTPPSVRDAVRAELRAGASDYEARL